MTVTIIEKKLRFTFPADCLVTKYDEWSYYRKQYQRTCDSSKAVDMVCITPHPQTLWLVEVKDYRIYRRTKVIDLGDEVAFKVRDTLAGLFAARVNANDDAERQFAGRAAQTEKIRIVLHLEQPLKHSKLFPRAIHPANIVQKLKQRLKAVDPHPKLVDHRTMTPDIIWTVEENRL
jgi:hypothetical protein